MKLNAIIVIERTAENPQVGQTHIHVFTKDGPGRAQAEACFREIAHREIHADFGNGFTQEQIDQGVLAGRLGDDTGEWLLTMAESAPAYSTHSHYP